MDAEGKEPACPVHLPKTWRSRPCRSEPAELDARQREWPASWARTGWILREPSGRTCSLEWREGVVMETSNLGRPLEGLDPGGCSSAPGFPCRKVIALEQLNAWSKATYVHFFCHNAMVRTSQRPPFNQHGPGYSALPSLCQKAESRGYLATLTVTDILIFACVIISLMIVLST